MGTTFDTLTHGFCEGELHGVPEYVNSFTSLALTFSGLIGLFGSDNSNTKTKLIFSFLAFNGIGSFGYHWTNYLGWRLMDEISMLLLAQVAIISIMDGLIRLLKIDSEIKKYIIYSGYLLSSFITIMLIIATIFDDELVFRIGFGFILAIIFFGTGLILKYDQLSIEIIKKTTVIGLVIMLCSSLLWIFSEGLCSVVVWIKYFPGHGLWHLGLAIGGYMIINYYTFILAQNYGKSPVISYGYLGIMYIDYRPIQMNDLVVPLFDDIIFENL